MAKLKPSASKGARYSAYKASNRFGKNKMAKIKRHLKKQPNDIQAQEALASTTASDLPTRQKPQEKMGWLKSNKTLGEYIRNKFTGGVTSHEAKKWASFIKASPKILFRLTPVLVTKEDGKNNIVLKHLSHLSNFKGKITAKTAKLKGADNV